MSDERSEGLQDGVRDSAPDTLLDSFDQVMASLPPGDPIRRDLLELRPQIYDQQETMVEARRMIEKLEEVIKKVTSPANRIGTFLGATSKETAHIVVGGADYYCNVDPRIPLSKLKRGTRVLVNEAFVIVGDLGFESAGPVTKITEVMGKDRLRVGSEHGLHSMVLQRSADLVHSNLKSGDEVRVDSNYRMALEMLSSTKSNEYYLDTVPDLPWEKVGGQEPALQAIKDAIELPLLHPDLFQKFQHVTPKGFLLYGPPGCGKTLIGKATAYNLTKQLRKKTGTEMREYFMHVKGPEILNMWVGESERMVREIFATAREKKSEGFMPFVFIDEAESILGTRRASRHSNILSTLVPMFCSEMDGIDSLNDVVIILASNRADLIDPAILRPGRIDRKIKVNRPDKLLEVTLRSGRKETLFRSDLISGAIIASIVERAKAMAIKRAIETRQEEGIRETDLQLAFNAEYAENDIFPTTDITEDWLKLIDYDPENVVKISPVKPMSDARARTTFGVI